MNVVDEQEQEQASSMQVFLWGGTHLAHDANGHLFQAGVVCPVATLVQVPQQALYHIAACLGILHNITSVSESR